MFFLKNRFLRVFFFFLLGISILSYFRQNSFDSSAVKLEVFETQNGWGYSIFHKENLLIYQPFMPAVAGNKGFSSKNEALLVGNLVCKKLKNGQNWSIKKAELDSLQITY